MRMSLEGEIKALKRENHELMEANINLADELKWAKEDKERLQRKVETALAYIDAEKVINDDNVLYAIDKYEKVMKEILENDFYEC